MAKTSDPRNPGRSVSPEPAPTRSNGQTDLARFDNSWYRPGPRWKVVLWFLVNSLVLNTYLPIPVAIKVRVLRLFGARAPQVAEYAAREHLSYTDLAQVLRMVEYYNSLLLK